jgi:hypothetical protein
VRLHFVLRVRETVSGTLDAPLTCSDAGDGCLITDAQVPRHRDPCGWVDADIAPDLRAKSP